MKARFLAQVQAEAAPGAVGHFRVLCVELGQQVGDDLLDGRRIIYRRQQVSFDSVGRLDQHPIGLGEVAEQLVIVPVVVVSGLEGLERLVEGVARDEF